MARLGRRITLTSHVIGLLTIKKRRFKMNSNKVARLAGFLYLIVIVFGMFSLVYARPSLVIPGDTAATISNIRASESLFRSGIVSELLLYVFFLLLPLLLYKLLKPVNKSVALLMVLFVVVSVPIGMLNTLNDFAALSYLSGADYLGVFSPDQLQAQAIHFLNLHDSGYQIAQIFFGLWLFPLGYLTYKSGFLPKFLGILLILGGVSLLINTFAAFLFPGIESPFLAALEYLGFSEILFCLWLLIRGIDAAQWETLAREAA